MKNTRFYAFLGGAALLLISFSLMSADHVDSPSVANTTVDISDFYAFEGENPDNTVFMVTLQGPLNVGAVTENAVFDEDVLVEFNIDNTGDFVEDLVIQAIRRDSIMYFFGPSVVDAAASGLDSQIYVEDFAGEVEISKVDENIIAEVEGMRFFAGPRRDPFFFDKNRYDQIISGEVLPEGFLSAEEATDFYADKNILAITVEVPNALLGTAPAHIGSTVGINGLPNAYNVWVTTKRKL